MLRARNATLGVVAVFIAGAAPAQAAEPYRSDELKFEIVFPGKPERRAFGQAFEAGKGQVVRFRAAGPDLRTTLSIVVYARPPFSRAEADSALALTGRRHAALLGGKIVAQKDLTLNGFPGKEILLSIERGGRTVYTRAQTYYADNRQYILRAAARDLRGVMEGAEEYFGSFRVWE